MAIPPFRASIDGCSPRLLDFFLALGHIPASICPWHTQTSPPMSYAVHAMPSEMNAVAEPASTPQKTLNLFFVGPKFNSHVTQGPGGG